MAKRLNNLHGSGIMRPVLFDCESQNANDGDVHIFDEQKAYESMARFVCSAEVPFRSIPDLVKAVNSQFPFSFATLRCNCLEVYKEEKEKIKGILKNFDGQVSLSIDTLSHDNNNLYDDNYQLPKGQTVFTYMCLNLHFIDDKWKPQNWVLYFGSFWDRLEFLPSKPVMDCLSDFAVVNKISTLTTSSSFFDYDELIEVVRDKVQQEKRLQLNGKLFRVYCCADAFRWMVEDAFEVISGIICSIRHIVFFGKSSPHWHVTLSILKEAIDLESKGEYLKKDVYEDQDLPSKKEWAKVRGVCKLVGSIYKAAEVLFETKNITASMYLINLQELRASLKKESASSYKFVRDMAQRMLEKFNQYWENMFLVLAVASVMDPRCKMMYIEFSSLKYEGSAGDSQIKAVQEAIHGLYADYTEKDLENNKPTSDSSPSDTDLEEELPKDVEERRSKPSFGFDCLDEYHKFILLKSQPTKSELELYLEDPVLPWSKDFNVLRWWRVSSPRYPILSKMARDLLAIPLSLATSYEAYYYTDFRMADASLVGLRSDLMNALVCTRSWYEHHKTE